MPEQLPLQPWMTAEPSRAVVAALEAVGGRGCARFVGGCVRDAVLRRPVHDVDIATPLTPAEVMDALEAAGIRAVASGVEHGTVTAVVGRTQGIEVTTLRRDVETDGRRAVVAFSADWSEDAQRRDFRLNALYAEPDGTLHDPTGGGLDDARAGRIIFVGDPETRLREDYLRILRFFRFNARFGRGEPDREGLLACERMREGLRTLSAERIAKELMKLLEADDPRATVRTMAAIGVLGEILPEARDLRRFEQLVEIESEQLFECEPELRLAALLPDDAAAVTGAAKRLKLSNALRERMEAAVSDAIRITSWMSPREMRRAVYRIGPQAFRDRVKLAWAASARPVTTPQWRMLSVYPSVWTPPTFPLSGEEIMSAGVPEGPLVGAVRREVEDWWLDLDFTDDKLAAIERLKAVVEGMVR